VEKGNRGHVKRIIKEWKLPEKEILRFIEVQIDQAIQGLNEVDDDLDKALFELRKGCKRIRAVLKLIRGEIGEKRYRQENHRFRDLARPFAELRDAKVFILTLDQIQESVEATLSSGAFEQIAQAFESYYHDSLKRFSQTQKFPDLSLKILKKAQSRLVKWKNKNEGASGIVPGLKQTYRQSRKCFKQVQETCSMERLHEWRKQTKYLWYQLSYLHSSIDEQSWAFYLKFQILAKLLGQEHDLAIMHQAIEQRRVVLPERMPILEFLHLIHQHRKTLQENAFQLGDAIYQVESDQFIRPLKDCWRKRSGG
jgi:CHAD domain-containing protein